MPGSSLPAASSVFKKGGGLGYSQLNELLLLLGFDRVGKSFFQYLVDGTTAYAPGKYITSLDRLNEGVERFRKVALLVHGNVKYAFKHLSREAELLEFVVFSTSPIDLENAEYKDRHDAIVPLEEIAAEDTFYLGYMIERDIKERLKVNPADPDALAEEAKRKAIIAKGLKNNIAYLASDHMDVYIATSMRAKHEYLQIFDFAKEVFGHKALEKLKLRYFDPTQAYCRDRIDKGLTEALMLKRAICTIYLAQETDTLGKDSELASTLAQGKPVIAYVPSVTQEFFDAHLRRLESVYPELGRATLILQQLQVFSPEAAWKDPAVRSWLDTPASMDVKVAAKMLKDKMTDHYEKRAAMLKDTHPLGIQVELQGGVANGVLVVRSPEACADLLRRLLMNMLEFDLVPAAENPKYLLLREKATQSVYRVVTGDPLLTNTFWNFYTHAVGLK